MPVLPRLCCLLALASAATASAGNRYKWKDANGVTHFSQTPPATGTHYPKLQLTNEPDLASNPPASAPASDSDSFSGIRVAPGLG